MQQHNMTCKVCGDELPVGSRSDRITCSDLCRVRRSRYKKQIANLTETALNAAYELALATYGSQFADRAVSELDYLYDYVSKVHADVIMHQQPRQWWAND